MGFLDDIFGRDKQEAPVSLQTPQQQQAQRTLLGGALPRAEEALGRYGEPYPGELTTQYERQGLDTLGDYLGSPMPTDSTLYGSAVGELEKTLGGEEYDPVGGTYYQAYRTQVLRELQEAKDRLASRTSASDKFFGGGRIATEGELEEDTTANLAMTLGSMFERERERRLGAVPMATGVLGAGEALTQGRVGASQEYGGLEFEREYGDYLRQMEELGIPLEVAMNLATDKGDWLQLGYEPSVFERNIMPIIEAGAGAVGSYYGAQSGKPKPTSVYG